MRRALLLALLSVLAGCGVDGDPRPVSDTSPASASPGVTVSGLATIGVAGRS